MNLVAGLTQKEFKLEWIVQSEYSSQTQDLFANSVNFEPVPSTCTLNLSFKLEYMSDSGKEMPSWIKME